MFNSIFKTQRNAKQKMQSIDAKGLKQRLDAGENLLMIDVRSAEEYASGHISGSRLIPLFTIPLRHQEIPQDAPIIMVCRSGARSSAAITQLQKLGFTDLTNLTGGVMGWQRAGFSIAK